MDRVVYPLMAMEHVVLSERKGTEFAGEWFYAQVPVEVALEIADLLENLSTLLVLAHVVLVQPASRYSHDPYYFEVFCFRLIWHFGRAWLQTYRVGQIDWVTWTSLFFILLYDVF